MKLHSPKFEDELIGEACQRLRARPEQMQQARHMEKRRFSVGSYTWFNLVGLIFLAMMLSKCNSVDSSAALVLFALWMLGLSFFHAARIGSCLLGERDLYPLSVLPVEDQRVFAWESQKAFRYSLWLLVYAVVGLLIVQPTGHPLGLWLIAAGFIWLSATSTAWLAYRHLNPVRSALAGAAVGVIFAAVMFAFGRIDAQTIISLVNQAGSFLLWLPTGWSIQLARTGEPDTLWMMAGVIAIGTIALGCLAFQTWKSVGQNYELTPWDGMALSEEQNVAAGEAESGVSNSPTTAAASFSLLPVEIRPSGIWESWYFQWLTPAEKETVYAAVPDCLNWNGKWKSAFKTLIVMALLVVACKYFLPQLSTIVTVYLGFMAAANGLPWGMEFAALFSDRRQGPLLAALHGLLPVSLRDITRAMWKAAALRMVMAVPLVWMAGSTIELARIKSGDFLTAWLVPGTWLAVKIWLIALALQPALPMLWFMRSSRFGCRNFTNFLWILLLGVLMLLGLAAAMLMLLMESSLLNGFSAMLVCSSLCTIICRYLYLRGKIDLLRQAE